MTAMTGTKRRWDIGLLLVGLASVFFHIPVWLCYAPLRGNDTASYEQLAMMICHLDFFDYDGLRTPGYPLFMLLCGLKPVVIWAVQSVMGVLLSMVAYEIARRMTRSVVLPVLAGLSIAAAINLHFFEAMLQAEILTAFLVLLSAWFFQRLVFENSRWIGRHFLLGLVVMLAGVVRPHVLFLGPLYAILSGWWGLKRGYTVRTIAPSMVVLLAPLLAVFICLSIFNQVTLRYFGFTTHLGFHLFNHTIMFVEKASDRFADIKDICVRQRDAHKQELLLNDDNRAFTRGYALEEIQAERGLDTIDLSRLLTEVSLDAIRNDPLAYTASVAKAWGRFWRFPLVMYPEVIRNPSITRRFEIVWVPVKVYWLFLQILFFISGLLVVIKPGKWTEKDYCVISFWLVVMCASVVQGLIEFSDNSRYSIPTLSLVAVVAFSGMSILHRKSGPS